MYYTKITRLAFIIELPSILLSIFGCSTVVRENILSSVETGTGISIHENPTTQLYEIRAGFIRSQFYSIPTGKVVKNKNAAPGEIDPSLNHEADQTPIVVSGIHSKSDWTNLIFGMDISENFAVGKEAVQSEAAKAMFENCSDK